MGARDFRGDVETEAKPFIGRPVRDPKEGWNSFSISAGEIGAPAFATESTKLCSLVSADTVMDVLASPCFKASPA
jgi:hypothetical protein